jgi:hypothetical protein
MRHVIHIEHRALDPVAIPRCRYASRGLGHDIGCNICNLDIGCLVPSFNEQTRLSSTRRNIKDATQMRIRAK